MRALRTHTQRWTCTCGCWPRPPALGLSTKLVDMIRSLSRVPACPHTSQQAGLRSEPQICWPFDSRSVVMTTMLLPPHAENGRRLHTHQCSASATLTPSSWQLPPPPPPDLQSHPHPTPTRSAVSPPPHPSIQPSIPTISACTALVHTERSPLVE